MIRSEWNRLYKLYSSRDELCELADYYRVKRWVKKVRVLYTVFSILAVLTLIVIVGIVKAIIALMGEADASSPLLVLLYPLYLVMLLLADWGMATLILQFKQVAKDVGKTASIGYQVGEQVQETHYEVTHEYGNHYRVRRHTEDKGCLFGMIAGVIRFLVWAFFCVYVGTFLTFRKYSAEKKALKQYALANGLHN